MWTFLLPITQRVSWSHQHIDLFGRCVVVVYNHAIITFFICCRPRERLFCLMCRLLFNTCASFLRFLPLRYFTSSFNYGTIGPRVTTLYIIGAHTWYLQSMCSFRLSEFLINWRNCITCFWFIALSDQWKRYISHHSYLIGSETWTKSHYLTIKGPVARYLVSAYRWLTSIETLTFLW